MRLPGADGVGRSLTGTGRRWGRSAALVGVVASCLAGVPSTHAQTPAPPASAAPAPPAVVLSPEDNRLNAYDTTSGVKQTVIERVTAGDGGAPASGVDGDTLRRDINGQVCVDPSNPRRFVAGDDTGQDQPGVLPGWGYFELGGDRVGELQASLLGKMTPAEYLGAPDNQGCGFLDPSHLVTTAIGDVFPFEEANGELLLWFGPFDRLDAPVCRLDGTLGTAGGLYVEHVDGRPVVYVAANRPGLDGQPGGVYRYSFPTGVPVGPEDCGPHRVHKTLFISSGPLSLTPSTVTGSGRGTFYVSSVFTGTVAEYDRAGQFVRNVLAPPGGLPAGQITGVTPFGLAVAPDGTLFVADIGVVLAMPVAGEGSVLRVRFDGDGRPLSPETVDVGLTYPDGLGVLVLAPEPTPPPPPTGSEWPCGNWGMFGRTFSRTFATTCPSAIDQHSAPLLAPAWVFRPPLDLGDQSTFTASPTVVDGVVYIGGWNGVMYALDADDGALVWQSETEPAPGATFGPIVSSAAVADVVVGDDVRRLVVVGAGPRLYAFDAADGTVVWTLYVGSGIVDDPAEVESSPVVYDGTVYVGMDVHNQPGERTGGVRGGLLAVDAATGTIEWKYEPEAAAGQPPSGCGGVWGSPTIDVETGLLYFGTANCPAVDDNPLLPMEEITALVAATGAPVWTFRPHQPPDLDEDFGATPNLFRDANGRKILGAGSKDGGYYALDPATGALLWHTHLTEPLPNVGGFIGSPATWNGNVFGATALSVGPAYHALDGRTGASLWTGASVPSYAGSAVVNGVVFAGALDSTVKAFDADNGVPLWASPVLGPTSSAPTIVNDTLFVGAGTSSSDLCAKGRPGSELCFLLFDTLLGQQGGVHAFRVLHPQPNVVPDIGSAPVLEASVGVQPLEPAIVVVPGPLPILPPIRIALRL